MARGYTTRKLQVFALHARTTRGAAEYVELFNEIAGLAPERRVTDPDGRVIAIPTCEVRDGRAWLVAYEGDRGVSPLIFNTESAKERVQRLRSGEVVAHKTHALIDLNRREAIVEYNHRGAKAHDIAVVLEGLGREVTKDLSLAVELNPFADEEFARSIARFERIRIAMLRVARPNVDWTDHYNDLTEVANDSDARTIEVTLTANRGGSLSKQQGVVRFIRDLASKSLSILKGAKVTGTRTGESAETTVSLAHHIEHQKVNVRMTDDGHVDDIDIRQKVAAYSTARNRNKDSS